MLEYNNPIPYFSKKVEMLKMFEYNPIEVFMGENTDRFLHLKKCDSTMSHFFMKVPDSKLQERILSPQSSALIFLSTLFCTQNCFKVWRSSKVEKTGKFMCISFASNLRKNVYVTYCFIKFKNSGNHNFLWYFLLISPKLHRLCTCFSTHKAF